MRAGGSRCLACDINCIRRKDSCIKMGSEAILGSVGEGFSRWTAPTALSSGTETDNFRHTEADTDCQNSGEGREGGEVGGGVGWGG